MAFLQKQNNTLVMSNEIYLSESLECYHGRKGEVGLQIAKCDITGVNGWCIFMDSSDGEYGRIYVSINHINEELNKIKRSNT